MFFCAQAVVEDMKAARGGAIINLGSVSWHLALPDLAIYQTAKAGIEGMTRAIGAGPRRAGIRVNCVVPGGVRTPRQMKLWHTPEEEERMLAQQCLKERVEPQDVAAMVLFLASDDARMCTATSISWTPAGADMRLPGRCAPRRRPLWSARERAVWFVDIKGRCIHRFDEAARTTRTWQAPQDVGFIVAASGGRFICGLKSGLYRSRRRTPASA